MKDTQNNYTAPTVETIDCLSEGVLCASNELITETEGIW